MSSIYTISALRQVLAGGALATYTVPAGYVFVLRDITAGTTASPSNPPLDVYFDGNAATPIAHWVYSAGQQTYHYDGRISCPAGTTITAKNNMGVSTLYIAVTGYLLTTP